MRSTLLVIRTLFFFSLMGTGSYLAKRIGEPPEMQLLAGTLAAALAVVAIFIEMHISRVPIAVVSSVAFGTFTGFGLGWVVTGLIEVVAEPSPQFVVASRLVLTVIFVYLSITFLLQTRSEFRFIIPYVEFRAELRGSRPALVDTSAVIDGRFLEACKMGLYDAPVVLSRLVLDELHALSDSQDKGKRARGRRGLDLVKALRESGAEVQLSDREPPVDREASADRKLIALSRALGAVLVTTDAGLQKVAELEGAKVLNVHELARVLQARITAGERLTIKVVKPGEGADQGVGYLEDGSMVVVEKGKSRVGQDVAVEVTGSIKTSAGQMFFAKIAG